MVLEYLLDPLTAEKKPIHAFLFGAFAASIALILAYWVFKEQSSLVMVFLATLAAAPFMYFVIKQQEQADVKLGTERAMLKAHYHVIVPLTFIFFGMTLSFALLYILLPSDVVSQIFSTQTSTIASINNHISGNALQLNMLSKIFFNNIRVLVFSILFAFLYGVGALFILTWNATVIATAIGNFIRKNISIAVETAGLQKASIYLNVFSLGIFKYALHGIPEIAAYFVGGLAGGIISTAVINKDIFRESKDKIFSDAAQLIFVAVGLLLLAALLEVFVTPKLF